jgi:hypothetical protein
MAKCGACRRFLAQMELAILKQNEARLKGTDFSLHACMYMALDKKKSAFWKQA